MNVHTHTHIIADGCMQHASLISELRLSFQIPNTLNNVPSPACRGICPHHFTKNIMKLKLIRRTRTIYISTATVHDGESACVVFVVMFRTVPSITFHSFPFGAIRKYLRQKTHAYLHFIHSTCPAYFFPFSNNDNIFCFHHYQSCRHFMFSPPTFLLPLTLLFIPFHDLHFPVFVTTTSISCRPLLSSLAVANNHPSIHSSYFSAISVFSFSKPRKQTTTVEQMPNNICAFFEAKTIKTERRGEEGHETDYYILLWLRSEKQMAIWQTGKGEKQVDGRALDQ